MVSATRKRRTERSASVILYIYIYMYTLPLKLLNEENRTANHQKYMYKGGKSGKEIIITVVAG